MLSYYWCYVLFLSYSRWSSLGEYLTITYAAVVTVFMCANFFVHQPPRAGTADGQIIFCIHMLKRVAACVTIGILLRCITFLVTILPGPALHCSYVRVRYLIEFRGIAGLYWSNRRRWETFRDLHARTKQLFCISDVHSETTNALTSVCAR